MPSNFLENPGTNGFTATPYSLLSTELNSLANGAAAVSSVGGASTSGVFTQTDTHSAIWGSLYFTAGGAFTPTAGGFLAGWFLLSPDGTNFETEVATPSATVPALSRAPDFTVPLDVAAFASGNIRWCQGRFIMLPWESNKVLLQNMSGAALPSSGNLVSAGPVAIEY